MLMLSRVRDHLSHLGLCNLISEDATDSFAFGMYLQHNPSCFGTVHGEEPLQDVDHELHGSVVVIDQNYLIQRRSFELGRRFFDDQARSVPPAFKVTHEISVYRARLSRLQAMGTKPRSQIRFAGASLIAAPHGARSVAIRCHFALTSKNKCLSAEAPSPYDCRHGYHRG